MCNQWLIAQPASVQRPIKLYSSLPISDRAHFKNCLLEGHTHTNTHMHAGETHFQTHRSQTRMCLYVWTFAGLSQPTLYLRLTRYRHGQTAAGSFRVTLIFSNLCPDEMFIISNTLAKKKNRNTQVIKSSSEEAVFGSWHAAAVRHSLSASSARLQLLHALLLFMGFNDMHRHTPGPASQSI